MFMMMMKMVENYEGAKNPRKLLSIFSKMMLDISSCWTWWTSYFEAWHKESGLKFSQGPKPLSLAWEDEEKAEKDISFKTSSYLSRRVRKGRVDEKGVFYLCLLLSGGGQTLKRLFVKYSFLAFSSLTHTHTHPSCAFVFLDYGKFVITRAHNLCHNNRQLIVIPINCNHLASKNGCS